MNLKRMVRYLPLFGAALIVIGLVAPHLASAATGTLSPGFSIVPPECNCPEGAGWGCVLQVVQHLFQFVIFLGVLFCMYGVVYAGAVWILSPINAGNREKGRHIFTNAVIGLVIVLSAYLLVNTLLNFLTGKTVNGITAIFGSASSNCLPTAKDATGGASGNTSGFSGSGSNGSSGGAAGSCAVPSGGPCSAVALSHTCFANRAQQASQVCNMESAGQASIKSGSDKLNGGTGPSYSVGLWQINLTTSKVGGLNCPAAFSGQCAGRNLVGSSHPGWCNVTITDQNLYDQCVGVAQDAALNTQTACGLYGNNSTFQPWAYSANRCNVPKTGA